MAPTLLLAACGGLASAVLYMSALVGSTGALILVYLAPLPLMVLGLGLGLASILLGGVAAAAGIAVVAGPEKGAYCKELGAEIVIDRLAGRVSEQVREATNGAGADVVYDPVGR